MYGLKTKEAAIEELQALGLSASALEQKCSRQVNNIEIALEKTEDAIDEWTNVLSVLISTNLSLNISIISQCNISDFDSSNLRSHKNKNEVSDG